MSALLEASAIPVSLVPERLIVEAARDEGIRLDQLEPMPAGNDAVLAEFEIARRVLVSAIGRWRDLAPSWTRLGFTMQHQEQSEWCWAATSVSVAVYYDSQTGWTQCTMVNAEKGLNNMLRGWLRRGVQRAQCAG
jgi:Papain-like cysteine protease AvrRpt2